MQRCAATRCGGGSSPTPPCARTRPAVRAAAAGRAGAAAGRGAAERARRRALPDYAAEGTGIDAEALRCALLSNGTYCLAVSEAGQSFARWHALSVCRRGTRSDPTAGPAVRLETDGFTGPLLPGTADGAQWRFTVRAAQFTTRHGDVTAVQTLTVPGRANGEVRALTLSSQAGSTARCGSCLRPYSRRGRIMSATRRSRGWAFRACCGATRCCCATAAARSRRRGCAPRATGRARGGPRTGAGGARARGADGTGAGSAGRAVAVRFALGVGAREDDAFTAARARAAACNGGGAAGGARGAVRHDGAELDDAMAAVSPRCSQAWRRTPCREQLARPAPGRRASRRPAGVVRGGRARRAAAVAPLRALGVACDLAPRSGDGGDYQQPTAGKVRGWLAALDLAHTLDAPGGVHLVPEGPPRCGGGRGHPPRHGATRCTLPLLPPPGDRRYSAHRGRCALGR
ncbi:MAG: hypothetical protein ACLTG4_01160 [Oscillospiraceae bacterium]